jgi:hypothetical protein
MLACFCVTGDTCAGSSQRVMQGVPVQRGVHAHATADGSAWHFDTCGARQISCEIKGCRSSF